MRLPAAVPTCRFKSATCVPTAAICGRASVSAIRDVDGTPTSLLLVSFDEEASP
jgi:hypothetical protein